MKRLFSLLIFLSSFFLFSQNFKEIYKENSPACVRIFSSVPDPVYGNLGSCGSGFIIDSNGIIVTNHHVIDGAKEITVQLHNDEEYKVQGFYEVNESLDFAILKIPGFDLPTVTLGNSKLAEVGDQIATIGNPMCRYGDTMSNNTLSTGDISQLFVRESLDGKINNVNWIKINAPISPGNSGGPLFNQSGEVIGINSWGHADKDAQNLNVALPINYVRGYLNPVFTNFKYNVDYDYIEDPWERYSLGGRLLGWVVQHLEECEKYTDAECSCILNAKKNSFKHPEDIVYHEDFIEFVNQECFDKNKDVELSETNDEEDNIWNENKKLEFMNWCNEENFTLNMCACTYDIMSQYFKSPNLVNWEDNTFLNKLNTCNQTEIVNSNIVKYFTPKNSNVYFNGRDDFYSVFFNENNWKIIEDFEEGLDGTLKYKGENIYFVAESIDISFSYDNQGILLLTKMWENLEWDVVLIDTDIRTVNNNSILYTKFDASGFLTDNATIYCYVYTNNDITILASIRCLSNNHNEQNMIELLNGIEINNHINRENNGAWDIIKNSYINDCLENEYSDSLCEEAWLCSYNHLISMSYNDPEEIDWNNQDMLSSIDDKCWPINKEESHNKSEEMTSEEAREIITNYLTENLEILENIEGIWSSNAKILNEEGEVEEEIIGFAICGIIKNSDKKSPYDFLEYIISADNFYSGEKTATFNNTNEKNIYFSKQKDPDGNYKDVKFLLENNILTTSKEVMDNGIKYIYVQEYVKTFPLIQKEELNIDNNNTVENSLINDEYEIIGRWFIDPYSVKFLLPNLNENNKKYNKIKNKLLDGYVIEFYEGYEKDIIKSGKMIIYIYDYNKDLQLTFNEKWSINNNNLEISNNYLKPIKFSHYYNNNIYFKTKNKELVKFYKNN
tara:strand:- start:2182 stop:4881 length:2700 start_codon:yes stop_codon:yes gene_type:complete